MLLGVAIDNHNVHCALSQKSATVAEFGDCRRCLAVFCVSVEGL